VKTTQEGAVRRQLSTLFNIGATRELTDGQLLERFSTGHGEIAELAFEALVDRHGPMVLRVCRAQLADQHDTQDAFQATFLILIKKARALWIRDSLGPWLHQVAFRTASCARSNAARRRRHEGRVAELAANRLGREEQPSSELERVLHAEINRLPECYRIPIVLCDLEAHSCEEAARRMGCPVGTVKSWRFRGRQRLRDRLIRLGLAPSAALVTAIAADDANAAVSKEIVRTAMRALSQWMTSGEVSASVRMLVKGVLRTMVIGKFWTTAAAFFAVVFLPARAGAVAWGVADDSKPAGDEGQAKVPAPPLPTESQALAHTLARTLDETRDPWLLTLPQAIQIDLELSELVRVISIGQGGTPSKIAPLKGGTELERFRSELMAHIRSIEQQYWNLDQAHAQRRASEQAVRFAKEILKHEQTELNAGRGTIASVAEAAQRFEQFNLDLVTRTMDVTTSERLLRNLMGLPWPDHRRIIPVSVPTEAQIEPEWEASLAVMLEKHPDVVRSRALVKEAEADLSADGAVQLKRRQESLKQVIHETTHSLARFFLGLDANFKQFKTASRLRQASASRLEAQQAYYKEGRSTIDRLMDAVAQNATAVATEAQYKSTFNTSIVALEEAKGTLLEFKQIALAAGPNAADPAGPAAVTRDRAVTRTTYGPPSPTPPPAVSGPPPPSPIQPDGPPGEPTAIRPELASPPAAAAAKTVTFQFTVGIGSNPIEIRGSFTVTPAPSATAPQEK
jgi:RNA polymerase sigma factor (sigma-70 family)